MRLKSWTLFGTITRGHMVMYWEGWLSYGLSAGVLAIALGWMLKLAIDGHRALQSVRHCERSQIGHYTCRILELELPYSAQVGFWNPELYQVRLINPRMSNGVV
ncbi:MAG TPA: hypothetical protein V6D20_14600 [Candidatus Obscuribacterales bacterium]